MTTPARNDNITTSGTGNVLHERILPGPYAVLSSTTAGAHSQKWVVDVRPASGSAGRVKDFRLCRGWSHLVERFEKSSNTVAMTYSTSPSVLERYTYTAGSFWPSGITPPAPVDPTSNMINYATVKALNNVKAQDVHLGNFIAEFHKTVHTVTDRVSKITQGVRAYKQRNPLGWATVKRVQIGNLPDYRWCEIPNDWLELQYGWKPLLSDIQGALQAMFKVARRSVPIIVASGVVKDELLTTSLASGALPSTATIRWGNKRTARVQLAYQVVNSLLHELSSLGLINPAEIVWEVTKYSFVVDWVLPVGPWLSSLTGDAGLSFITGTVTKHSDVTFRGCTVVETDPRYKFIAGVNNGPTYVGRYMRLTRTCLTSSPTPGLYVKNPMSALHVANAIALLAQAFGRR
jgi:hypothetical protein